MKLWLRLTLTAALAVILCSGFGLVYKAAPQARGAAAPAQAPTGNRKAGEYFKNVTTSTLKELTVDDFIAAMLERIRQGKAGTALFDQFQKVLDFNRGKGFCALINMPGPPILSALRLFPSDFASV